ncbi:OmpA/MotB family protein [Flavicella sediminum]|uniref:OmpA/MotB family protein n=1 Tax=Flavicella sediminum TaxID=2585141 RepID=UPI00111DD8A4|nr:OmpA family protein [Flavicella sediminum]
MKKLIALFSVSALLLTSCVSKKQFTELQNENSKNLQELAAAKSNLSSTASSLDKEQNKVSSLEDKIKYLLKGNEKTLEFVDNLTVLSKSANENVKATLTQLSQKDEYIKQIQALNSKRDSINLAVAFNLKKVLNNGLNDEDIQVNIEKTVVYISIADKLLFNSGSFRVSNRANAILKKVADVINAQPEMDVIVEGHTDSKTIKTDILDDNWDLSVKRATSIVRELQHKLDVDPSRLVAAGRSSYQPLVANDSPANMAKNRRTKIIIMPKLDQFFDLLDNK